MNRAKHTAARSKHPAGRFRRALQFVVLAGLLAAMNASAHGPFDTSGRLILRDDQLELMVVMGNEAAARFLKDGPAEALQSHGPSGSVPLPNSVAARLGTLQAAGVVLDANRVAVHADGLEVAFIVAYPRPASGPLEYAPLYFTGIPEMLPGVLAFVDENGNALGTALLSAGGGMARLPLPGPAAQSVAAEMKPAPAATAATIGSPQSAETRVDSAPPAPSAAGTVDAPSLARPRTKNVLLPLAGYGFIGVLLFAALRWMLGRLVSNR